MTAPAAIASSDRTPLAIGLVLIAFFSFSFVDTGVKWLVIAGIPALQLSFMRYVGHFAISAVLIASGGLDWRRFATDRWGVIVVRGLLLLGSTVFNFFAVGYLPLTLTATILFSAPIIVCALSGPMLGERVGIWRWSAIIVGFIGVLIAIRPFGETFHPAAFLSLAAATCFAVYVILTRKVASEIPTDTMQFYSGLVGTVAMLPFAILEWQTPATGVDWTILVMLGVFAWAGHQLLIRANAYAPPSAVMPFSYSFIVYLTIWSALVFGQLPDGQTLVGAAIIVAAGLFIWFRERRLQLNA